MITNLRVDLRLKLYPAVRGRAVLQRHHAGVVQAEHGAAVVRLPVGVGELQVLDWVGLDVEREVGEVAGRVQHAQEEDEAAHDLVEVDVVVQGQDLAPALVPQEGDGVPQHEHDDDDGEGQDVLTSSPGGHVEEVGGEAAQHGHVAEVDDPLGGDGDHDEDQEEDDAEEVLVVVPVLLGEVLGDRPLPLLRPPLLVPGQQPVVQHHGEVPDEPLLPGELLREVLQRHVVLPSRHPVLEQRAGEAGHLGTVQYST